jgi:2-(1,2-epoxy-1,2-dihydrophenyl)acetyl-CoA isomerase
MSTSISDPPVVVQFADDVASISLRRPGHGNALDLDLASALSSAVAEVARAREPGAVLIRAEGPAFCVGGDLRAIAAAPDPASYVRTLADAVHETILALRDLSMPVISAVHGACAGGGIGLALAADIVIAEHSARFRAAYTAAGLTPDSGLGWLLPRTIGPARAADLILANRVVDGTEAERLGLVSRVVPDGTADDQALVVARSLAGGPREAFGRSVRLIRDAASTPLRDHLNREAESIAAQAAGPEGSEGIAAFLEKRLPDFSRAARRS